MINQLTKSTLNKISKKYKIRTLYLFGSRATGRARTSSDYDFAAILDKRVSPTEYSHYKLNIISELLRLLKTEHIDLVVLNSDDVPLLLKYNIIKEGKVIYDRDKSERVAKEADILRRWLNWQYFEKMWGDIHIRQAAAGKFN
jgi:hypothetical protein